MQKYNEKEDMMASPIERIDEDCLECIFQRLPSLYTQIQAARSCSRFLGVMKSIWRRSHKYETMQLEEWREIIPDYEDLKFFVRNIQDSIKTIMISDCCLSTFLKDLEDFDMGYLPNVEYCSYVDYVMECYPSDHEIRLLTRMMPNLKILRMTQPISGRYLANLKQLEELHLYEDQDKLFEIKQEYLEEICTNLTELRVLDIRAYDLLSQLNLRSCIVHMPKLEVLKLNLNTLKPVLDIIIRLPGLKKLCVLLDNVLDISSINVDTYDYKIYETDEFYKIVDARCEDIVSLAVDTYYMPLTVGWEKNLKLYKFDKLTTLAICNWSETPNYLENFAQMSQLSTLCCRNWSKLTNEIVLTFIDKCHKLEHLDICYCKELTKTLLYKALVILNNRNRKPLYIYYLLSGIEDEVESRNPDFWQKQTLIKFSSDFPPNCERGLSYVDRGYEIEFA